MITRENYSIEHIMKLHESRKRDPNLIERVLFAFGLLEALRRVELPFIFKGGTSLLLLLDKPMRLSTDIDIIVEPGTEVDVYLEKAAKIFPFKAYEEQIRKGKNNIEKRHFKFQFESPRTKEPVEIILDILFESSKYANIIDKNIDCELLLTEPEYLQVKVPDVNSILADKLTAFAPHTTGVLIDTRKDLEIMKQMFDVYSLIYLLTLLTFPYFQGFPPLKILYMYPFPLFLPLWDNYKGKFIIQLFNRCLPLYQEVLRKSALLPL